MERDNYKEGYDCEALDICPSCMWYNGEQCIRELLTEEDIQEIITKKNNYGRKNNIQSI